MHIFLYLIIVILTPFVWIDGEKATAFGMGLMGLIGLIGLLIDAIIDTLYFNIVLPIIFLVTLTYFGNPFQNQSELKRLAVWQDCQTFIANEPFKQGDLVKIKNFNTTLKILYLPHCAKSPTLMGETRFYTLINADGSKVTVNREDIKK